VLTNGDVDAIAGLLHLREGTAFSLYAHAAVLKVLDENPIFEVVDRKIVPRRMLTVNAWQKLLLANGKESGIEVKPFPVPGKVPLYREGEMNGTSLFEPEGYTLGLELRAGDASIAYIANCAEISDDVIGHVEGKQVLFVDGTLFRDDEMIEQGVGTKTGRRMGHVSISGPDGVLERLKGRSIGRPILLHLNNTNPVLLTDSSERRLVEAEGFEVAYDGMEIRL
jgi:pyrroloquinoline quinone biosynthesis protein B